MNWVLNRFRKQTELARSGMRHFDLDMQLCHRYFNRYPKAGQVARGRVKQHVDDKALVEVELGFTRKLVKMPIYEIEVKPSLFVILAMIIVDWCGKWLSGERTLMHFFHSKQESTYEIVSIEVDRIKSFWFVHYKVKCNKCGHVENCYTRVLRKKHINDIGNGFLYEEVPGQVEAHYIKEFQS